MVKKICFVGAVALAAALLLALPTAAQKEAPVQKEAPTKKEQKEPPAQKEAAKPEDVASILATLEGTINFCTRINPEAEAKYKDLAKLLTNNQTDEAVAQIRNSKEYKDALEKTSKQLGALSSKEALEACKAGAQTK